MTERLILPFSDVGGGIKPADGAKLYFSDTGLTFDASPKDTYTDSTKATSNANPVIADSLGVFPEIWLSGSYRAVLKDKNEVQIWQADEVNAGNVGSGLWKTFGGAPTQTSATTFTLAGDQTATFPPKTRLKLDDSTTLYGIVTASAYTSLTTVTVTLDSGSLSGSLSAVYTSLATPAGKEISASSISYLNTDIAAANIYALDALLNTYPVSVLLLGATVGGDLYAALTATQTYDIAHAVIPAGDYTLSATWVINKAFRLDGAGSCSANESNAGGQPGTSTTRITCSGSGINGIEILGDGTEGVENVHLSNFSLWGTANMNDGIQLGTGVLVTKSSLTNVHVRGFTRTGKFGIRWSKVLEFTLTNVYTQFNYYGMGNLTGDVCTTMRTFNTHSRTNSANGVFIGGTFSGGYCASLLCEGNTAEGIVIAPGASDSCTGNSFPGYYSEANGGGVAPIVIGSGAGIASDITFSDAKIDDNVTGVFGGKSIHLDRAEKISFNDCELTTYNSGFIEATANTLLCQFRTAIPIHETAITGNSIVSGQPAVRVLDGDPNIAMGTITRDISAADGAVNETGLGFLPKAVHFHAAVDNTPMMSVGMSDGTQQLSVHDTHGVTADSYGIVTGSIILRSGGSVYTVGTITIDTIGQFTITWAKTGAPTGTAKIFYTAFG